MNHRATYSPEDNKLRLYPAFRLDRTTYDCVRAAGFIWAPKQELFVTPMWTPSREDLLLELCGEIEDEDKSLVERQEERADRFTDYSTARAEDAEQAKAAVDRIADNIPLGQPILVGHHSERHARKDAERIENGMRKAVKMWETSHYWKDRAAGAIRHAKYKELPAVRARRIKGLESDIRVYRAKFTPDPKQPALMSQKWGAPADSPKVPHVWCSPRGGRGGSWVAVEDLPAREKYYTRLIEHCERRLEYERAMLEADGGTDLLKPAPRPKQLPLCNYLAPDGLDIDNIYRRGEKIHYPQVQMTQAEYARIHNDYKATRVVGNSHRVRTAMRNHTLVCVFLSDSKTHVPPAAQEPAPREPRRIPAPIIERAPDPKAQTFDAMREQLKTGVQLVSANQLFPTPPDVAERMVELASLEMSHEVLEPSAGTGALTWAILQRHQVAHLTAVEINQKLADNLRASSGFEPRTSNSVRCADFLTCNGDLGKFDRVLMNPPFENGADIKHIKHALTMLKHGGRLVAICANGPRQNEALQPLASVWEELPSGMFEGTNVRAVLLTIEA